MSSDLVKGIRAQLGKLATREEVAKLRDELAESRALRKSLEKRLHDIEEADAELSMPPSIAKRRAAARAAAAMDLTL